MVQIAVDFTPICHVMNKFIFHICIGTETNVIQKTVIYMTSSIISAFDGEARAFDGDEISIL